MDVRLSIYKHQHCKIQIQISMPHRGYLFVDISTQIILPIGATLRWQVLNLDMSNTYTQLYIHFIFAVKYRTAIIQSAWEERLHKYITGIVQNNGHKLLAINSANDHIHLFIGLNPQQSISELMRLVKGDSSEFINKEKLTPGKFSWQSGYGAFSNSRSQLNEVIGYIQNQKKHHAKKNFRDEYLEMLNKYEVDYDDRYIFLNLLDG